MAVRIKIKIEVLNKDKEAIALANSGYETEKSEILLPIGLAREFELYPELPQRTTIESYSSIGGIVNLYKLPIQANVSVIVPEKEKLYVAECEVVISEIEKEVILSDAALSELMIVIEDAKKGFWHFLQENIKRESYTPQYW